MLGAHFAEPSVASVSHVSRCLVQVSDPDGVSIARLFPGLVQLFTTLSVAPIKRTQTTSGGTSFMPTSAAIQSFFNIADSHRLAYALRLATSTRRRRCGV
jgi:hypothetical protein